MSRKAIDRAREEITAGWLAGDADAILVHMTDDAMFLGPHEPPVVGKSAIQTWLNQFFSQISMTKVEMVEDRDVFISGDLAVETVPKWRAMGSFSMRNPPAERFSHSTAFNATRIASLVPGSLLHKNVAVSGSSYPGRFLQRKGRRSSGGLCFGRQISLM